MSDSYDVDGVLITPQAGGYYELKHASLPEPHTEKVRGKEVAETRAREIAVAAQEPEGSMPPQPPLTEVIPTPPVAEPTAIDELRSLVNRQAEMIERLLARDPATVNQVEAPEPDLRLTLPTEYRGTVNKDVKAAAKKIGVEYVTIILEEGNDIPPTGLFLGHNGRSYMICPGEPVDVPDFLLGILDHAVMSAPILDNKSQKVLGYRDRMKYPYRRV